MMMTAAVLMNWKAAQLDVIAYSCWVTSEDITFQHTVVHETTAAYIYLSGLQLMFHTRLLVRLPTLR
jgi:hypothetical protein